MSYLSDVQIKDALLRKVHLKEAGSNSKVCVMSLASFFDRIAPALILTLGLSVSLAFAQVVGL
jgi:hypothetical protein